MYFNEQAKQKEEQHRKEVEERKRMYEESERLRRMRLFLDTCERQGVNPFLG